MELHYLGTAAAEGWPGLFCRCESCNKARERKGKNIRTRHSAMLDGVIKFDYGPDTYLQTLREGLDLGAVEHLLMTHSHYDHLWAGDLVFRMEGFQHGVQTPLTVHGNDRVLTKIRLEFGDYKKALIELKLARPFAPFAAGDAEVVPLRADHDPLETCLNYLVTRAGKTLLYAHDTGWWPEDTWEYVAAWAARGGRIDLATFDCTFGPLAAERNHMGIATVARFRDRLLELGAFTKETVSVVSHFSHNGRALHEELEAAAAPHGLVVAYDGLKVRV